MSERAELPPLFSVARHSPATLTPPPRYARHLPGGSPRFLYLYNRNFLILISLFLFITSILLAVGLTLNFFPNLARAETIDGSKTKPTVDPRKPSNGNSAAKHDSPKNLKPRGRSDKNIGPPLAEMKSQRLDPSDTAAIIFLPNDTSAKLPSTTGEVVPETCTNGGEIAACCRAHGWKRGVCILQSNKERHRAICWRGK